MLVCARTPHLRRVPLLSPLQNVLHPIMRLTTEEICTLDEDPQEYLRVETGMLYNEARPVYWTMRRGQCVGQRGEADKLDDAHNL